MDNNWNPYNTPPAPPEGLTPPGQAPGQTPSQTSAQTPEQTPGQTSAQPPPPPAFRQAAAPPLAASPAAPQPVQTSPQSAAPPPPPPGDGPPARPAKPERGPKAVAAGTAPRRGRRRTGHTLMGAALLLAVVVVCICTVLFTSTALQLLSPGAYSTVPTGNSFSVVTVVGTIQNVSNDPYSTYAPSYCHADTLYHIKSLAENDSNTGILLYMNTPGGGVYESDEVYRALMDYKEQTGRPVWAYMADTCASGGYYICAAADRIITNRNTTTGSIGVYVSLTDTSELFEKLGIETVLVRSGANKGTGTAGVPITEGEREVYQEMVDEHYEEFVSLVAAGRGMSADEVRPLADGRVYTGAKAAELGLVDEVGNWDDTLAAFEEETGATPYYPTFNRQSKIARLIGNFTAQLPRSETDAMLDAAQQTPSGVPMALYDPAYQG